MINRGDTVVCIKQVDWKAYNAALIPTRTVQGPRPELAHTYTVIEVRDVYGIIGLRFAEFPNSEPPYWSAQYFRKVQKDEQASDFRVRLRTPEFV
jgi:hypothetical protein